MSKRLLSFFKKISERHQKALADKVESFNDPFAKEIEWGAITRFRYGFLNRKLLRTQSNKIFFIPSLTAVLFHMGFILMGAYVMWEFSLLKPTIDTIVLYPVRTIQLYIHYLPKLMSSNKIWGHLLGFAFLLMGLLGSCYSLRPIVFNTANRLYSKGLLRKEKVSFDDIHAIQIISETGNEPEDAIVYELNLVLKNKTRVNVFGHPKKQTIVKDATALSQFLSVPVWDIT